MDPCTHQSRKEIRSDTVHLWCKTCGSLYCFVKPIGWAWVPPKQSVVAAPAKKKRTAKRNVPGTVGIGFLIEDLCDSDD